MDRSSTVLLAVLVIGAGSGVLCSAPHLDPSGDGNRATEESVASVRHLLETGRFQQAIAALEPLAEQEGTAEIHRLLGEAYLKLGLLTEARQSYATALQLDGESAPDRFQLGRIYLLENKYALAVEHLRQAQRLGVKDGELHQRLAVAYCGLNNYLGRVRTVTARGQSAGRIVGEVYLLEPVPGRADAFLAAPSESAVYHSQRALDEGQDSLEARLTHARIWLGARWYARAAEVYASLEQRVARSTLSAADQARIAAAHAQALYGADDMEGYLAKLKRAVALDEARFAPVLADGFGKVAARYNQRGDLAQYLRYLELAVAESPKSARLHYRLGNGYWEAGRKRQAAREWRITLQIAPDHPDRRRILELIQAINAEFEGR